MLILITSSLMEFLETCVLITSLNYSTGANIEVMEIRIEVMNLMLYCRGDFEGRARTRRNNGIFMCCCRSLFQKEQTQ